MGRLCPPCLDFLRAAQKRHLVVHLITCCGSTDAKKDEPFGYGRLFAELKGRFGAALGQTQAFPIELIVPEDQRANQAVARLDALAQTGVEDRRLRLYFELCRLVALVGDSHTRVSPGPQISARMRSFPLGFSWLDEGTRTLLERGLLALAGAD